MSALRDHARAVAAAFTFLTRLPLGNLASHNPADLPRAAIYFPAVGLAVGLAGTATYAAASLLWPTSVAVALSMVGTTLVTGAFHEDALADALDGFGGGWTKDRVLAIMKDSRVGSYALVGTALALILKFATLVAIADSSRSVRAVTMALIAAHVSARWSSLLLIWRYPYVRPTTEGDRSSAGRPFVDGMTPTRLLAATVLAVVITATALGRASLVVFAVAVGVTALAGRYFDRRIGGITGDAVGAANQVVEICVYLALAARLQ
jgi:adenosylcobinamide-GDP ribazoletransferase